MILNNDNHKINLAVSWIDHDQLKLTFSRTTLGIQHTDQEYYLSAESMIELIDYINDTLAR